MNCSTDITGLLEITKIQILKVIHNSWLRVRVIFIVVCNHKDTNFESNSQLVYMAGTCFIRCWKSQRYKF